MNTGLAHSKYPRVDGTKLELGPNYFHLLGQLAKRIDAEMTITVPMLVRDPRYGAEFAATAVKAIGCVASVCVCVSCMCTCVCVRVCWMMYACVCDMTITVFMLVRDPCYGAEFAASAVKAIGYGL